MAISPARQALIEMDAAYPETASRQLARMAYKRYPALWPNETACLTMIRAMRGAQGNRQRHLKKLENPEPKIVIPEARKVWKFDRHFDIPGPATVLVMSDIHIPFHDVAAVEAAVAYGKAQGVTHVLLLGDALDCHTPSFWETDPRERDFPEEIETAIAFFKWLRSEFPKAKIILKDGNHEERYERFMIQKAPELLSVKAFQFSEVFELAKHGIEHVTERRKIRIGKLLAIHGHEVRFSSAVNPARGLWLKMKVSAIAGHLHRSSTHSERDGHGHTHFTYGLGCLCDLEPKYAPMNEWTHGFATVRVEKDGAWHCDNKKIIDGKVY